MNGRTNVYLVAFVFSAEGGCDVAVPYRERLTAGYICYSSVYECVCVCVRVFVCFCVLVCVEARKTGMLEMSKCANLPILFYTRYLKRKTILSWINGV